MYNWYVIVMNTRKNQTLYLSEGEGNSFKWAFNINDGIWFETKEQAEKLAKNYFKNFDKWFIKEFEYIY